MAVAVALGATSMSDIAVLAHLAPVLGTPSGPTVRRALDLAGTPAVLDRIARARASGPRARVGPDRGDSCRVPVAGHRREDPDRVAGHRTHAALVTASSDKEGAAPTWKKGYGFHPLGAWLAEIREPLAMLLRPGNAGVKYVHRSQGRAGCGDPAGPGPVPAQDPGPCRWGRGEP